MQQGIAKTMQTACMNSPKLLASSDLLIAGYASRGAIVQAIKRCPCSTNLRRSEGSASEPWMATTMDQPHRNDVFRSITAIEKVLENLKETQRQQRQLFHEQAEILVPALDSPRMEILFQEAAFQQSTIMKNINNIEENLLDAGKRSTKPSFDELG